MNQEQDYKQEPTPQKKRKKQKTKGVVYLSSIPTHMNPTSIRKYFHHHDIQRIYLAPQDHQTWKKRIKSGGNKKRKYKQGWLEFEDKKQAKNVAMLFNGQMVGGKKRHNLCREDLWCIRYLPKFKWEHLNEHSYFEQKIRSAKLQSELNMMKKQNQFYLNQVDMAYKIKKMKEKREKLAEEKKYEIKEKDAKVVREFRQRESKD